MDPALLLRLNHDLMGAVVRLEARVAELEQALEAAARVVGNPDEPASRPE